MRPKREERMESEERETTITWSDADRGKAIIWTSQRPMVTRFLRIRGAERQEVHRTEAGAWTGETWAVPVRFIHLHAPRRVSDTERERRRVLGRSRGFKKQNPMATVSPKSQTEASSVGHGNEA